MKKLYIMLMMLPTVFSLSAQDTFHKYYSLPNSMGMLSRCIQTSDGGYAAVGYVTDLTTYENDFLVIKTDINGNASWIKRISGPGNDEINDIAEVAGGDLVVVGTSMNLATFVSQVIVERFNTYGDRLWCRTYSLGEGTSAAKRILAEASGSLLVLGSLDMPMAASDYYIMRLDGNGNILGQWTFGTPESDVPTAFLRLASGDFVIAGFHNTGGPENIHLLKINAAMEVQWSTLIQGPGNYLCYDLAETSGMNILLAGRINDGLHANRPLIAEIDQSNGQQVWAKNYFTSTGLGTYVFGITVAADYSIAVTGVIEDVASSTLIFSTDPAGNVDWIDRIVSFSTGEFAGGYGISKTSWGGYVVSGPRSGDGNSIAHLLTVAGNGDASCPADLFDLSGIDLFLPYSPLDVTTHEGMLMMQDAVYTEAISNETTGICLGLGTGGNTPPSSGLTVFPNPTEGKFTVTIAKPLQEATLTVFNSIGWPLYRETGISSTGKVMSRDLNLHLSAGVYWVELRSGNTTTAEKIVVL
jgi:hypothetical protein